MKFRSFDKYTSITKENVPYLRQLAADVSQSPYRPKAHICPPCGLLNDPNGLCWYEGYYHVFYQWYPFGPSHGMKHWAHVKSRDFADWEWCDQILIPSEPYEKNGCYSGNAFVNPKDGNCYLYYTANYKTGTGRVPKQAAAIMTPQGSIRKYEGNPVIDGAPEGISGDIRDPFVFEQDGCYYMLLGGSGLDGKGRLLLYSSQDLLDWSYNGCIRIILDGKETGLGTMVECPGYIRVDGQDVLFLSLIGLAPKGDRYHNQFTSLALIGELDIPNMEFKACWEDEADCGFDFYAPQPFYGKDGSPMVLGWFGCGEQHLPEDSYHWRHALTLPRKLHIREERLYMPPAPEAIRAFGAPASHSETPVSRTEAPISSTEPVPPGPFIQPAPLSCLQWSFENDKRIHTLSIGGPMDYWTLTIDMSDRTVTWDRSNIKLLPVPAYGTVRRCSFTQCSHMDIDIFMDNSFVEIYIQNGERVLSGRIYL